MDDSNTTIDGIPSGFLNLDEPLDGFKPGQLVVLAGQSGCGKTGLALSIVRNIALKYNLPVGVFCLEASKEQVIQRLIAMESDIPTDQFRKGRIDDEEWDRTSRAFVRLANAPIFIDDNASSFDVNEVCRRVRYLHIYQGIKLVVIDYLQLLTTPVETNERESNTEASNFKLDQSNRTDEAEEEQEDIRKNELTEIVRKLKNLARVLNIPILLTSQVSSNSPSYRYNKAPNLYQLKEYGSLEEDADLILLLHKEDLYNPETEKKNVVEIYVAKHRTGPMLDKSLTLYCHSKTARFADIDLYYPL